MATKQEGDEAMAQEESVKAPFKKEAKKIKPEVVLKKRKSLATIRLEHEQRVKKLKAQQKLDKAPSERKFKRAEKFIQEFRLQDNGKKTAKKMSTVKKLGSKPDKNVKLVFAYRTTRKAPLAPNTKKMLRTLRCLKKATGAFILVSKETSEIIRQVSPYIVFGYPTHLERCNIGRYPDLKTVEALVMKKGFGRLRSDGNKRVPLTDNSAIEKELGKFGVVCLQDIVHEIYTVGKHFNEVNAFLCPFHLSNVGLPAVEESKDKEEEKPEPDKKAKKVVYRGNVGHKLNDILKLMI